MELRPGGVGTGIVFHRSDDPSLAPLRVRPAQLTGGVRGTNLSDGKSTYFTIEHVLAACWACGVDNLEVHLDADEPPAGDGSARPFIETLLEAGIERQAAPRPVWKVVSPVTVKDEGARLVALPHEGFHVTYTLDYPGTRIGCQYLDRALDRREFQTEVAPARTFCLMKEVEALKQNGLGLGGSLENAVVVDGDQVVNPPLRFEDEFVRHKVLDLVGDLATLGGELRGHFIAAKSGHRHNIELVKKLITEGAVVMEEPSKSSYSFEEIKKILPHRYPFLLIDRITELEAGVTATGLKNVSGNEPFFEGHFPEMPVMPGVLILEALAQVAGMCILSIPEHRGRTPLFTGLDAVKFRRPVVPGDQLHLVIKVQKIRGNMGWVEGIASVDSKVVAEGILKFTVR